MKQYGLFVNGAWAGVGQGPLLTAVNPFTGEVWAEFREADEQDVAEAVAAAATAQPAWAATNGATRARVLNRIADVIEANAQPMAVIESTDNGKVIRETSGQMLFAARLFRFFAGYADKLFGQTIPLDTPTIFDYTTREPCGVVALITAWNSPITLLCNKLPAALAAGKRFVSLGHLLGTRDASGQYLPLERLNAVFAQAGFSVLDGNEVIDADLAVDAAHGEMIDFERPLRAPLPFYVPTRANAPATPWLTVVAGADAQTRADVVISGPGGGYVAHDYALYVGSLPEQRQWLIDPFAFFPFSGGRRMCIGQGFAMMEGVLILATLAQRFHLELVPGHPVTTEALVTLRPRHGVKVIARPVS